MNRKEKNEMKQYIGQFLDIAGGRYTDEEVEALYDAVENREFYNGRSYSAGPRSHDSWYSEGKFTRTEQTTWTFRCDSDGIRIDEDYSYHDDDGQEGGNQKSYSGGHEFLQHFWLIRRYGS